MEIKWNQKNLNSLYKKLDKIGYGMKTKVENGLKEGLTQIQKLALEYKRGPQKGILIEVTDQNGILKGRVYTDKDILPYAMFLEFGTGIYAELPHVGTTKTFIASGYQYWYLPVEKATREFKEKININGCEYYVMYAQKPSPFMRKAGFEGKDMIVEEIEKTIYEFLKEVVK